ncbi:MAG: citrate synthase [bacterium]
MSNAKLTLNGQEYDLPVVVGTEGEVAVDVTKLRAASGAITLDPGYGNTGSCLSGVTFIDGEKGILRYRGYPIEDLAENASFDEVMYLLIWGELPTDAQLSDFRGKLADAGQLPEAVKAHINALPANVHPMAAIASITVTMSAHFPESDDRDADIINLLAKFKAIVAWAYRRKTGQAFIEPNPKLGYVEDFLTMMFGKADEATVRAMHQLLILHADHEQNCSASTVRMVGSSQADVYATMSAGICALWGPLHGGANQAVIEMLEAIQNDGGDTERYVEMAKDKESGFKLMGFGHRVYKNFDPRARIIKKAADEVLDSLGIDDPSLDIAKHLEKAALEDEFFVARKLYPNVDFYSGIIYRALNIPTDFFTVMFALGRMPGWIAQWRELREDPTTRIHRPRQVYVGANERRKG